MVLLMTRPEVIYTIATVKTGLLRDDLEQMKETYAEQLGQVLDAFATMELTAAKILGSKGGKTPPKPGSRPRGRPRKEK